MESKVCESQTQNETDEMKSAQSHLGAKNSTPVARTCSKYLSHLQADCFCTPKRPKEIEKVAGIKGSYVEQTMWFGSIIPCLGIKEVSTFLQLRKVEPCFFCGK